MTYNYNTKGVCARNIKIDVDENQIIRSVEFTGGCNGNLKGVSALVAGKPVKEVITLLQGIRCGVKSTSCPDQLAEALRSMNA